MTDLPKIVTIIQTRMESSRLPKKVMLPLKGKPLLQRMYERVAASKFAGTIVIATTVDSSDDPIIEICRKNNLKFYRGHSTDLLDRHYKAAKKYGADAVVKIPSDCPLIDPKIIDDVIKYYIENENNFDFVSNLHPASYPDGNDVEVMKFSALENAWNNASRELEREHTTPYFWENPDKFRIGNVKWDTGLDYSMSYRFTIDYPEDYQFIKKIYDELYSTSKIFSLNDVLDYLEKYPDVKEINQKYAGVNWYRNHLSELNTISPMQTKIIN